jgi:protein AbiQ
MESLRLYRINSKYINYLRSVDKKVQFNKQAKRPYVGIVLYVGEYRYFAPLESPKDNHKNIKSGKHLVKIDNGNLGLIGFNNMIPINDLALIEFDINAETDVKYAELLKRQVTWLNKNKATIYDHANKTYYSVANNTNKFLVSISCNFKNLEKASKKYNPKYRNHKKVK